MSLGTEKYSNWNTFNMFWFKANLEEIFKRYSLWDLLERLVNMSREFENDLLKNFIRLPKRFSFNYKLLSAIETIGKLFILIITNPKNDDHFSRDWFLHHFNKSYKL